MKEIEKEIENKASDVVPQRVIEPLPHPPLVSPQTLSKITKKSKTKRVPSSVINQQDLGRLLWNVLSSHNIHNEQEWPRKLNLRPSMSLSSLRLTGNYCDDESWE